MHVLARKAISGLPWRLYSAAGYRICARNFLPVLFIRWSFKCCCFVQRIKDYQCHICSSHPYNPNLTSGPSGPRQIGNYNAIINVSILQCEPNTCIYMYCIWWVLNVGA